MKVWMMSELLRLSRSQLLELLRSITSHLGTLAEGSVDRRVALDNLERIHAVLNRPVAAPRRSGWTPPAP